MTPRSILQVSTTDIAGGAERIAWDLFQAYRTRGLASWLAVGRKVSAEPNVVTIPNADSLAGRWSRYWRTKQTRLVELNNRVRGAGLWRVSRAVAWVASPRKEYDRLKGIEDFHCPGTRKLLQLVPQRPDILHCHNLHGGYFDLRALPGLSRRMPVVLTLHDAWLLSGHCAHSFDCERWKTGCGECPDLTIYPALEHDGTAGNWQRKRALYANSRLYVSTPSKWLMNKVDQSNLQGGIVEKRVIPNGVDLTVFRPGDRAAARAQLGLPPASRILLFAANGIRQNIWKDFVTLRAAITLVAERLGEAVTFLALGEQAPVEQIGRATLQFAPFENDPRRVALYYQAADVYVHAARVDTFPNTVLESLACGVPVVATAVGGIPEEIHEGVTGFLTPGGDPVLMAARILDLLQNDSRRLQMGQQAAAAARQNFDLQRQVNEYLAWYGEILDQQARRNLR